MFTQQEMCDHSVIRALRSLIGDDDGIMLYGFDDIPSSEGYYCSSFDIRTPGEEGIVVALGQVATDEEMTHHLILTYYPLQSAGVYFPFLS